VQNRPLRIGPAAVANAAANIFNPGTTTGGVNSPATNLYAILTHVRLVNKTGASATCSLYIGATGGSAAGTEFAFNAVAIPANSSVDWYGRIPLQTTDFLTGVASAAATITFEGDGEVGVCIA
jgi:hypothetical protein